MKIRSYKHVFVSRMPEMIEEGILYVCLQYKVIIHKCACGCGEQVVTPIDPKGWTLEYNGEHISLSPSIGNWNYYCESHYWIKNDNVVWAPSRNEEKVPPKERKRKTKIWDLFRWRY